MHAAQPHDKGRGTERLLAHCAVLDDAAAESRLSPLERLQDAVGADLARLLVNALAARGTARPSRVVG